LHTIAELIADVMTKDEQRDSESELLAEDGPSEWRKREDSELLDDDGLLLSLAQLELIRKTPRYIVTANTPK
jgi:hypothetical protein